MSNPKRLVQNKRLIILAIAMFAITFTAVTTAWLNDTDATQTNVFVSGKDLTISFDETTGNGERIVPGDKVAKNPTVTVEAGSEPCYLFVKGKGNANTADFLDYNIDGGWSPYSEFIIDGKIDPAYQTNNTFYFDSTNSEYDDHIRPYISNSGNDTLHQGDTNCEVQMWVAYDSTSVYIFARASTDTQTSKISFYYDPDPATNGTTSFAEALSSDDHGNIGFAVDQSNNLTMAATISNNKAPYYDNGYIYKEQHVYPFRYMENGTQWFGAEIRLPRVKGSDSFKLNFCAEREPSTSNVAWSFGPNWWASYDGMRSFDFNNTFVTQNYDGYYYRIIGDVEDGPLTADQTFYILQGLVGQTDRNGNSMANGYVQFRSKKQNGNDIVTSDLTNPNVTLTFKAVAIQQKNLVLAEAFKAAKPELDS